MFVVKVAFVLALATLQLTRDQDDFPFDGISEGFQF